MRQHRPSRRQLLGAVLAWIFGSACLPKRAQAVEPRRTRSGGGTETFTYEGASGQCMLGTTSFTYDAAGRLTGQRDAG